MDKHAFRQVTRSADAVMAFLQDPQTAQNVHAYLRYTNGADLPEQGVIAGQAVSTAIDYLLGLRDKAALDIKDIDIFRTATPDETAQSPMQFTQFVHWLSFALHNKTAVQYYASTLPYRTYPKYVTACTLYQYVAKHYPSLLPPDNYRIGRHEATVPESNGMRIAQWRKIFALNDPLLRQLKIDACKAYAQACQTAPHLCNSETFVKTRLATLPQDITWVHQLQPPENYDTRTLRLSNTLIAGHYTSRYGLVHVLPEQQAVQTVLTTPVSLAPYATKKGTIHVFAVSDDPADMGSLLRVDSLRHVRNQDEAHLSYAFGIVGGFDINSVQVGLHLNSMQLVFSSHYVAFLCNRELQVVNTCTPSHSLVRALDKSKKSAVYVNESRLVRALTLRLASRMYACNQDQHTAHQIGKLQDTYDAIRLKPTLLQRVKYLNWFPVLLSHSFAHRAMAHESVANQFSMEAASDQRGFVLVPKKAEAWHLSGCTQYTPPSVRDETTKLRYSPAPSFLDNNLTQLLAQYPEMAPQWQRRTDRLLAIYRQISEHGYRSRLTTFCQQAIQSLLRRQCTSDQAYLLDTDSHQHLLVQLAHHSECRPLFPHTQSELESLWQTYHKLQQAYKDIKPWVAQIEREFLQQHPALAEGPDQEESLEYHTLIKIRAMRQEMQYLTVIGLASQISLGSPKIAPITSRRRPSALIAHLNQMTTEVAKNHRSALPEEYQYLVTMAVRLTPSIAAQMVYAFDSYLNTLVSLKLSQAAGSASLDNNVVAIQTWLEKALLLAYPYVAACKAKQMGDEWLKLQTDHPVIVQQPELLQYLAPLQQFATQKVTAVKDWSDLVPQVAALHRQYLEATARSTFLRKLLTITDCQTAPVIPLAIEKHWDQVKATLGNNKLACAELLTDIALTIEGSRQSHCVGSYFAGVCQDASRILTLSVTEGSRVHRATVEWVWRRGEIHCNQIQGFANQAPHATLIAANRLLLSFANKDPAVWQRLND